MIEIVSAASDSKSFTTRQNTGSVFCQRLLLVFLLARAYILSSLGIAAQRTTLYMLSPSGQSAFALTFTRK